MSSASQQSFSLLETLFEQSFPRSLKTPSDQSTGESVQSAARDERSINISALSLNSSDAQQLMHCYQLALDYGVPTARRALAMYQAGLVKSVEVVERKS